MAGTEVLAAGGGEGGFAEVAIEDIKVGDEVWARDELNPDAPMVLKRVTQLPTSRQRSKATYRIATGRTITTRL